MKSNFYNPILILLLVAAVAMPACSLLSDDVDTDALEIHLQSSFNGERVQVKIDGHSVYDQPTTTDHRIGLAEAIELERREGPHRIEVIVDGRYRAEQAFRLKDRRVIGVTFFAQSNPQAGIEEGIHFFFYDSTVIYD